MSDGESETGAVAVAEESRARKEARNWLGWIRRELQYADLRRNPTLVAAYIKQFKDKVEPDVVSEFCTLLLEEIENLLADPQVDRLSFVFHTQALQLLGPEALALVVERLGTRLFEYRFSVTQTSREEQIRASLLPQVIGIYFEVLEAFGAMAAVAADAIGSYLYMSHHGNCREHDVGQEARMFESCAVALGRMGVGLGVQLLAVKRLQNLEIPAARISLAKALRGAKVGTWPSGVRGKGIKLLRRLSADRDLRVAVEAGLALSEANYNVSRRLLDRAITDPNAMAHESNTHGVRGATELVVKAAASLRPAQVMKVVGLLDVQNPGYGNAAKVLEAVPVEMLKSHIDGLIERFEQPEQNYLRRRGSLSKLMAREGIGSEIVTNDARWARILALLEVDVLAYETWEFLQAVGSVILHRLDWLLEQDRHPRRWGHDRVVVMIGHATPAVTSPAVAVLVERTRLFNDREVRKAACKALGGLASCTAEMFEALMAAAKGDPHHEVRVQALYALKGFVSELSGEQRDRLAELYAGLFEDETCSVRIQAPRLYQAFGAPARPVLLTQARRLREAGARDLMHADHHLLQETEMALVGLELAE